MAIIHRLSIQDWGPFADATLTVTPLTVLVGPNDSGKTTLIHALQRLRAASEEGAVPPPTTRRLEATTPWCLRLEATQDDARWILEVREGPGRDGVRLWLDGDELDDTTRAELRKRGLRFGTSGLPEAALLGRAEERGEGAAEARRLNGIHRLLRGIRLFRPNPAALRTPSVASEGPEGMELLREDGGGLPTVLGALSTADPGRAVELLEAFRAEIPTLSGYRVRPDRVSDKPGYRLVFTTSTGGELGADQVSDGVLLTLAFLTVTHLPDRPSLLMVEEPENGLHPARLRELAHRLRGLAEGASGPPVQVLLTTHMPYLLDEVEPHEAWFCHRDEAGRALCIRFEEVPGIHEELRQKYLGELWAEHGEQALFERWRRGRSAAK
jgi:predicted ATPase